MNIDMKNTFIYKTVLLFAALSVYSGHELNAQNMTVPYKIENGIAYKKSVSQTPDPEGKYTVRIETFVTGEVSTKQKPIPADIVLVLDVSGSMSDPYSTAGEYIETDSQDYSYSSLSGYGSTARYYLYEGNYYQVHADYYRSGNGYNRPYHFYLYFNDENNTPHYLFGSGIQDERPSTPSGNYYSAYDETIFSGILYRYTETTTNRLEALQDAAKKFIQVVKEKDSELKLQDGQVGNQIAIVKFAGETKDDTIDEGNETYNDGGYTYNYTQVVKQFKPVASSSTELEGAIDDLTARGATSVDYGLTKAQKLFQDVAPAIVDENGETVRSRTVVVFTDGNPTHSRNFDRSVAISAVNTAKQIKATSGEGACSATVFTVGVFGDDKDDRTDDYMDHMSSNYPDASAANGSGTSINYTGYPLPLEDDRVYSIIVDNNQGLAEVFETIADISSGQNTTVGDDSVLTLDVVSNSFKLPEGVSIEDIHVYTAQCLGLEVKEDGTPWLDEDGNQYLAFAEPIEAKDRPKVAVLWVRRPVLDGEGNQVIENGKLKWTWEKLGGDQGYDIDQNITPSFDAESEENSVSVVGFNYSDYWCGLDEDHENTEQYNKEDYPDTYKPHYRGFKLILEFPITTQPDAVGGPSVVTNGADSGIYQTDEDGNRIGEPLVKFNRPRIKIPVQIWIQKQGLEDEDSAVLTLYATPYVEGQAAEVYRSNDYKNKWTSFTKVIVNSENMVEVDDPNNPGQKVKVVKLVGLDPDYYYRLKEDAWAFGYEYQTSDGVVDTIGDDIINPITLVNKREDLVSDEAVVRNVFSEKTE